MGNSPYLMEKNTQSKTLIKLVNGKTSYIKITKQK